MSPARLIYTTLWFLLTPLILLRLLWRARRQPAYLRHIGERFGRYSIPVTLPLIWVHAVSVGETRAAAPLVEQLRRRYPNHGILLTHMTPTGRETGEHLFGDRVLRCYLPYDYPFAVQRFLSHFKPSLGVLLETEVWPNLITAGHRRGIPIALVNARLSARSAGRYAHIASLARETFGRLDRIGAQTEDDAQRISALGTRIAQALGNIKFDIAPPADALTESSALRMRLGEARPVLVIASTREGEEALILDALKQRASQPFLTVIVPRHPHRFDEVAALIEHTGLRYQRRSAQESIRPDTTIVLGDSMGEMFTYYGVADLAFIGGSLLQYGGQNLIEACAMGTPVLLGPHTYNFTEASKLAIAAGAARRVADAGALFDEAEKLLADRATLARMSEAARQFWQANQGATERTIRMLAELLPAM